MSLPAGEQRVLRSMENALRASEPRLASMFAIFARLNLGEPVSTESLQRRPWPAARGDAPMYAAVVITLVFAVIVGALIGGTAHGAITCGSQYQTSGASLVSRPACALAAKNVPRQTASPAPAADRPSCTPRPVRVAAFPYPGFAGATTPQPSATC